MQTTQEPSYFLFCFRSQHGLNCFYFIKVDFNTLATHNKSQQLSGFHPCCYLIFDPCFGKFSEKSKNSKKTLKIKFKKRKKLRDQVWKPSNIFAYKYRSPQHTQGGAILKKKKKNRINHKPNPNPKTLSLPSLPPLSSRLSLFFLPKPPLTIFLFPHSQPPISLNQ